MSEIFLQGIGFAGVALFILSYQLRSNRALYLCQLLGSIVFCLQFALMGAWTGVGGLLVTILRNALLFKAGDWKWVQSPVTLGGILLLLGIVTAATWSGWASLLPLFSVAAITLGYWTRNAQKIRLSQLFGSPCILTYDLIIRSWGGALSEAITLGSILVSIWRFGWKELGERTL